MLPSARKDNLVVQKSGKELLVYDLGSNKAICLNRTSALIWESCDGATSPWEIGKKLRQELGEEVTENLIWFALEQLHDENLLDNKEDFVRRYKGLSRRDVISKIGLSSLIALPIIASLTAPKAINAQSTVCLPGGACTCNTTSMGMVGQVCTPAVGLECVEAACQCSWANNGNDSGTCIV